MTSSNAILDHRAFTDPATIGNQTLLDRRILHRRGRQELGSRVDRRVGRRQMKRRIVARQTQTRFIVRLDRADVLPVAVEQMHLDSVRPNRRGEDLFAEVADGRFE